MATGAEAIAIVQLIDACIAITNTIIAIGQAVKDAHGLPPSLKELCENVPAIGDLLNDARDNCAEGKVPELFRESARPIFQQCEKALSELRDIFRTACPKDDNNRSKLLWKGAKTVFFGRQSKVHKLLVVIQDNLQILEQKEIYHIGDRLDELQQATEALCHDDGATNFPTEGWNIFAIPGGKFMHNKANSTMININFWDGASAGVYPPLPRPESPPRPSSNIPFHRNPRFIQRVDLTDQIRAKLSGPEGRAALVGIGGSGKSQLAIEYARQVRQESSQTWVLWINARKTEPKGKYPSNASKLVVRQEQGGWLVILDNVDDAGFLVEAPAESHGLQPSQRRFDYFPSSDHGSLLITSRTRNEALRLTHSSQVIPVGAMSEDLAEELLEKWLGQSSPDNRLLASALRCMPLAISQAAAYIRGLGTSYYVGDYRQELEKSRKSRTSLLQRHSENPSRDKDASNSILLTWQISFDYIYTTRKSAADLLSLMSFCDRVAIPEILLLPGGRTDKASSNTSNRRSEFLDDIFMLRSFSFVSDIATAQTWEMHRLVQDAMQSWLNAHGRVAEFQNRFIHHLEMSLPGEGFEHWPVHQILFPHVKAAAKQRPSLKPALLEWASIMRRSAWYMIEQGNYTEAVAMATASRDVRAEQLGKNDLLTADSIETVATALWRAGKSKEAEPLHREVLSLRAAAVGEGDLATLRSMNELAMVLKDQGQLEEEEELQVKVVDGQKAVLGEEHPDTLRSLNNLASTFQARGRLEEAEGLQVKALEGWKAVLGEEHPDTLSSMNNLALTVQARGRLEEAEWLQVKVLERRKAVLGEEHPDTLRSLNNLASTFQARGRLEEAGWLQVKALEGWKAVLGEEHPDTLTSMHNLGVTYADQKRWSEAEELAIKSVAGRMKVLGARHPDTLQTMRQLENIQQHMREQITTNSSSEAELPIRQQPPPDQVHDNKDDAELATTNPPRTNELQIHKAPSLDHPYMNTDEVEQATADHPPEAELPIRELPSLEQQYGNCDDTNASQIQERLEEAKVAEVKAWDTQDLGPSSALQNIGYIQRDLQKQAPMPLKDVGALGAGAKLSPEPSLASSTSTMGMSKDEKLMFATELAQHLSNALKDTIKSMMDFSSIDLNISRELQTSAQMLKRENTAMSAQIVRKTSRFVRNSKTSDIAAKVSETLQLTSALIDTDPVENEESNCCSGSSSDSEGGQTGEPISQEESQRRTGEWINAYTPEYDSTAIWPDIPTAETSDDIWQTDRDVDIKKAREFFLASVSWKWLVTKLSTSIRLCWPARRFDDALLERMENSDPDGFTHIEHVSCRLLWDLVTFVHNRSEPGEEVALRQIFVVTGWDNTVQMLTCGAYVEQTWPLFGSRVLAVVERALEVASTDGACRLELEEGIWLEVRIAQTSPQVTSLRQKDKSIEFAVDFTSTTSDCQSNYGCWRDLCYDTCVAFGFPILARSDNTEGMELDTDAMIIFGDTDYATTHNGHFMLKGFSTMFLPLGVCAQGVIWHFIRNIEGPLSYSNDVVMSAKHAVPALDMDCLSTRRHFVGWTPEAEVIAGTTHASYNIRESLTAKSGCNIVLEKATINGGKFVGISATVGRGQRRNLISVGSSAVPGFRAEISQFRKMYVVLYDTQAKRGWLIDGVSALLHITCAQLQDAQFRMIFDDRRTPVLTYSEHQRGGDDAFVTLFHADNCSLPLWRDYVDTVIRIKYDAQGKPKEKLEDNFRNWSVQDQIKQNVHVLRKIFDHQANPQSGVDIRLTDRTRLEGWSFRNLIDRSPTMEPRMIYLSGSSGGWVEYIRQFPVATLMGESFGQLIRPKARMTQMPCCECTKWSEVPIGKDLLATSYDTLREIAEMSGASEWFPHRVTPDLQWHQPHALFEPHCPGSGVGKSRCDRIQELLPLLTFGSRVLQPKTKHNDEPPRGSENQPSALKASIPPILGHDPPAAMSPHLSPQPPRVTTQSPALTASIHIVLEKDPSPATNPRHSAETFPILARKRECLAPQTWR
ncbi:hypothetical protein Q7P37_002414 [Cladosporium fusiforme]